MVDSNPTTNSIRTRYVFALAMLIVFIIALFFIDALVSRIITTYLPGLDGYIMYAWEASNALVGVVGSYVIYRILVSVANIHAERKHDYASAEVLKIILRVVFGFVAISIALTAFGISLSGALAGGAIGGVIIGLAAQTITTSLLSGFLVASSKTLLPGDMVLLRSSYWGGVDMLVKITHVSTLYTDAITQNGNTVKFPNPILLNYTVLTHMNKIDGQYLYVMQVTLNYDVSVGKVKTRAQAKIDKEFRKRRFKAPEIVFFAKGMPVNYYAGLNSALNTFNVLIRFNDITEINELVNIVNNAFDEAYWEVKK